MIPTTPPDAIQSRVMNLGHTGRPISCTAAEWPEMRTALQAQAGKWVDEKQDLRATLALAEVRRLDALYANKLEAK